MVRRIAHCYRQYRESKALAEALYHFTRNRAATKIQRIYYRYKIMYMNAAKFIQRAYRRFRRIIGSKLLLKKIRVIVSIQRVARGYIVRISERYTLAQVYLRLPSFWREVMKIQPVSERREKRSKIQPYQLAEARKDTRRMLEHILDDVVTDRVLPPKLPLVVPQPFDKAPYVSLSDGRRLNFENLKPSLLSDQYKEATKDTSKTEVDRETMKYFAGRRAADEFEEQKKKSGPREPLHPFNMKFWPLTMTPKTTDTSVDQFDSTQNSFDVVQNSRLSLACEVCRTRLRIILCNTCMKGFCFFCAFRTHTEANKRNHKMQIMEPRVVKYKQVSTSLTYHVDMAQAVAHDLSYLVKYMRSAAEVKRIQRERQLLREFEQQEEARRISFLKASQESKDLHDACTVICLLYRSMRAKSIVAERRLQLHLERALVAQARFSQAVVTIQRTLRMHSTRQWLHSFGLHFDASLVVRSSSLSAAARARYTLRDSLLKLPKPRPLTDEDRAARVGRDTSRRVQQQRQNTLCGLETQFTNLQQLLFANRSHWSEKHSALSPQVDALVLLRNGYFEQHRQQQTDNIKKGLSATANERDHNESVAKNLHMKLEAAMLRVENARNMMWWVEQQLRMLNRKISVIDLRFSDTLARAEWAAVEFAVLVRIEFHMRQRLTRLREDPLMELVTDWVSRYLSYVILQQTLLDSLQESILREEVNKLQRDERLVIVFDSLLEELQSSLRADNQYTAEKVWLDNQVKLQAYGSSRAVELNEQLILLKSKQKQLTNHTLDPLREGLQTKFDDEDTANMEHYGFPNDHPDLPVSSFPRIAAEPILRYTPGHHCQLADFLNVYLVQPWLVEQSIEDVRFEEQIAAKQLSMGTLREQLKSIKTAMKLNEMRKANNEKRVRNLKIVLENSYEGVEGEAESEAQERAGKNVLMQAEIQKLESDNSNLLNGRQAELDKEQPLVLAISKISEEMEALQQSLGGRVEERDRRSKQFFDLERSISEALATVAMKASADSEQDLRTAEKHIQLCLSYSSEDGVIEELIQNKNIELDERAFINVPLQPRIGPVHQLLHDLRPRTVPHPVAQVRAVVQARLRIIRTNQKYFRAVKAVLDQEQQDLELFSSKRDYYEKALKTFNSYMVNSRRQRALQKDIEARKARLEQLRALRVKSMQEAKQRQVETDREAAEIKAEKDAKKRSMGQVLAQNAKAAIRNAKDAYRDMRYKNDVAMDEEEEKLLKYIQARNKEGVGSIPEGVKEIKFTVGAKETEFEQQQNDHLRSKALPYFRRMERSLGNHVFIWTLSTRDSTLFLTSVELGHRDSESEHYKTPHMRKQHFELLESDAMDLQLWVKRDRRKEWGIKSFSLSFTEEEETRLVVEGFRKIDTNLQEFGLPDTCLWVERVDKIKKTAGANAPKIRAELKKMQKMLDESPADKNIQGFVGRLQANLAEALQKEKDAEISDHLQAATDLLALSPQEIDQWKRIYSKLDKKKEGRIGFADLFEYFGCIATEVTREVFLSTKCMDDKQTLDLGGFIRACSIYCLFGKVEIIQFIYVFVDVDREGLISAPAFGHLLETIHPYEKLRARRVLKQLKLPPTGSITHKEFLTLNDRFPAAFNPMFVLQDAMRTKTMGEDWWFFKMNKYRDVRRKMGAEGSNTDALVNLELNRFKDDADRDRRMGERAAMIRQETSEVKKTLLKARQFLDEFS